MGFWFLLGPCCLATSLFVSQFSLGGHYDLWMISMVSVFLCWAFRYRGLILSLSLLVLSSILYHFFFPSEHLWNLGVEFSVAFGIWVSYISFTDVKEWSASIEKNRKDLFQKISFMEETFKKEEEVHQQYMRDLQKELTDLDQLVEGQQEEKGKLEKKMEALEVHLQKETQEKEQKLSVLVNEKKEFLSLLQVEGQKKIEKDKSLVLIENDKKRMEQEKSLICQEKDKLLALIDNEKKEKERIQNEISKLLCEKENLSQMQGQFLSLKKIVDENDLLLQQERAEKKKFFDLHKQLQVQFKGKSEILHDTRKELFLIKEKMIASQREQELVLEYPECKDADFSSLEETMVSLEQENLALQEIIQFLNKNLEKKGAKKREKKMVQTELSFPVES
ncbi:MAG: hypothetical protein WCP39_03475 [Chlamydiota bacterium]